jgi:hypothetical protein
MIECMPALSSEMNRKKIDKNKIIQFMDIKNCFSTGNSVLISPNY